jgi:hypothetical protein
MFDWLCIRILRTFTLAKQEKMISSSNTLLVRATSVLSLAGATGLLVWWFMMPLLLPVSGAATHFEDMIRDPQWIPVNLLGLASTLLVTLGFPMFFLQQREVTARMGNTGLMLAFSGLILFTCIQYYETIIWPAAAYSHPELVGVEGALVKGNQGVLSGILLGAGYLMFGISFLVSKTLPRAPLLMLITGTPVFANGIIFPVRTLGLMLFCGGTIWLALHLKKLTNH